MSSRTRIGFVDLSSIHDRSISAGVPFSVAAALNKWCGDVVELGPFPPSDDVPLRHRVSNQLTWTLLHKTLYWPYSRPCIVDWARRIQDALNRSSCDVVFAAERSRWALALLDCAQPIVIFTDSTMRCIRKMGGYFTDDIPALQAARAARMEEALYRRANAILVSSAWARNSVVKEYGVSPDRVTIAPFGANVLPHEVPSGDRARRSRSSDACRLLWVGANLLRKGGDKAIAIVYELEKLGISASLTLVLSGMRPSTDHPRIEIVEPLNKSNPAEARRFWELFRNSDFYVLPTRGETFGIGCAEASAFGMPTVASAVGGIPHVVRNDVNGILVDPDVPPTVYARHIAELYASPEYYRRLSAGGQMLYQTLFNWDVWGQRAREVMANLGLGRLSERTKVA